jgi:Cys-tRNA(Pro)/Cys-tRNA(Cys) deacylase
MARRKHEPSASTPALARLVDEGIDHTVHEYAHDPRATDFGAEAARQMDVDPTKVFKTLIWHVDDSFCVAIVPTSGNTAPKMLAAALGARRADLVDSTVAERLSGSVVGAISPLGLRRALPVVVDSSALDHDRIFVSAGRRGVEVSLSPADLIELTSATVATIRTSVQ